MDAITRNLNIVHRRIRLVCKHTNRDPKGIRLLLATKTVSPQKINLALQHGESLIGENKAQELKQKYNLVKVFNPEVHFIGHLQSNKIKEVIKWVTCIESIDRLSIAEKLSRRLVSEKKEIDVYIQVNTSYEQTKFGVIPNQVIKLIKDIATLENIHIKGLMTIGLFSSNSSEVRKCFQLLKSIQHDIKKLKIPNVEMKELSMGMSSDLEIAIEEGATIVRVGTDIFGERIYPDSHYWNEHG